MQIDFYRQTGTNAPDTECQEERWFQEVGEPAKSSRQTNPATESVCFQFLFAMYPWRLLFRVFW